MMWCPVGYENEMVYAQISKMINVWGRYFKQRKCENDVSNLCLVDIHHIIIY